MINILQEEIRAVDTSRKALRSFGLLVGAVLFAVGTVVLWLGGWSPNTAVYVLTATGGVLMLIGATTPGILRPVYFAWMALAVVLGFVMTRLLLTAVFFVIVTPIGLMMRIAGRDPLNRKIESDAATYWIDKSDADDSPARLEKYY